MPRGVARRLTQAELDQVMDWYGDEFWTKVNVGCASDCWEHSGHVQLRIKTSLFGDSFQYPAHRLALEIHLGRPLIEGMNSNHHCTNPKCCNHAHLYEGTQQQNVGDAIRLGNYKSGENHPACKLTDEQVTELRSLAGSMTQEALGEKFGISQTHAGRIIRGERR